MLDQVPDRPLRFEFESSETVVQFPLGFCPSHLPGMVIDVATQKCHGRWGFVIKEWETITAPYPQSAQNLNRVTKQVGDIIKSGGKHFGIPNFYMLLFGKVDIDLYNDLGEKVPVEGMSVDIQIIIPRMKEKDPLAVSFDPCEI